MLYNIRTNQLIIGKTLWSPEALKSDVVTVPGRSSKETFVIYEPTSDKILTLTGDLHLQLDLLCQTVDVQGTASYLRDDKYLKRQAQAFFRHETKTDFRYLTMKHLKDTKIAHPEILEEDIATHVVVGIQYGGEVIMNFVEELEKKECSQEFKCKALVKTVEEVFSTKGDVGGSGENYGQIEKIRCHLFSDFPVDENPTNLKEAVEFYKKLPSLTGRDNIGIPLMLHLCPLQSLGKKGGVTVKPISSVLIYKVKEQKENLLSILASCEDLVEAHGFPSAKRKLELFMDLVQKYKRVFLQKVSELHHGISHGSANNDDLDAFVKKQECSVFSYSCLSGWLKQKGEEMKAMQGIMKPLKDTPFVTSGELEGLLSNLNIYHVVCLAFKIFPDTDTQLLKMNEVLEKGPEQEIEKPFLLPDVQFASLVRASLERFRTLKEDNQYFVTKFVLTEETLNILDPRYVCLIALHAAVVPWLV